MMPSLKAYRISFPALFFLLILFPINLSSQKTLDTAFRQISNTKHGKIIDLPEDLPLKWLINQGFPEKWWYDFEKYVKGIQVVFTDLDSSKYNTFKIIENYSNDFSENDGFEIFSSIQANGYLNKFLIHSGKDKIDGAVILSTDGQKIFGAKIDAALPYAIFEKWSVWIKTKLKKSNPNFKSI
ncbi:MAG: hypothetical protein H6567_09625 [Lewinellaceae bacterium]|nr:hypothetical protein [Lewinellaceae bacterium]